MKNLLLQSSVPALELYQFRPRFVVKTKEDFIAEALGQNALHFVQQHLIVNKSTTQIVYEQTDLNKIAAERCVDGMVNLLRFNDISRIDDFFENANKQLEEEGIFIGYVQTNKQRQASRNSSKGVITRSLMSCFDFLLHRIPSKVNYLKPIYFKITKGKNRRLSKAEICGRFVRSGFTILEINEDINGNLYFAGKKTGEPKRDDTPSSGLIYKMPRLGKNGKIIGVYKFRTMHAYSEYLQDYVLKENGYGPNGKPANDFRVTSWGKIMRKFWMDEAPQLINVIKGEMKLVGVRPVSKRYFQDIPEHLQELRLKRKPGCIPPYVAFDMEGSKEGALASEEKYLQLGYKDSILTDFVLIWKAARNIIIRRKRSA